jgi:hypothetical protein
MSCKDLIKITRYLMSLKPIKTTITPTIYNHNGAAENIFIAYPNLFPY